MKKESGYDAVTEGGGEVKEQLKKGVLKISEMALFVNGEYVGELGNPSYSDKKGMFVYDPKTGLDVHGTKSDAHLESSDLVQTPHDMGYVSIARTVGERSGDLSGNEFGRLVYRQSKITEGKISKFEVASETLNIEWDSNDTNRAIYRASAINERYSPEDLLNCMFGELEEKYLSETEDDEDKKFGHEQTLKWLKGTGVFDVEERKNRDGIISYCYWWLNRYDVESDSDLVYKALEEYPFLTELIEEFRRSPDGRFGGALLVACETIDKEWRKEEEEENERQKREGL